MTENSIDPQLHQAVLEHIRRQTLGLRLNPPIGPLDYDIAAIAATLDTDQRRRLGTASLQLDTRAFERATYTVSFYDLTPDKPIYRSSIAELLSPAEDPRLNLSAQVCATVAPRTPLAFNTLREIRDQAYNYSLTPPRTLIYTYLDSGWDAGIIAQMLREAGWEAIDDPTAGDLQTPFAPVIAGTV